jgi:hypothetical protein
VAQNTTVSLEVIRIAEHGHSSSSHHSHRFEYAPYSLHRGVPQADSGLGRAMRTYDVALIQERRRGDLPLRRTQNGWRATSSDVVGESGRA